MDVFNIYELTDWLIWLALFDFVSYAGPLLMHSVAEKEHLTAV